MVGDDDLSQCSNKFCPDHTRFDGWLVGRRIVEIGVGITCFRVWLNVEDSLLVSRVLNMVKSKKSMDLSDISVVYLMEDILALRCLTSSSSVSWESSMMTRMSSI